LFLKGKFPITVKWFVNIGFVVFLFATGYIMVEQKIKKHAVVTQISTPVYSGDNESYTEMFDLLDGQIVEIVREEKLWSQIQHKNNLGWVKKDSYERI
jgi:hypothetical protein